MSEPEVPAEPGGGALRSFLGLFVVPLLVVVLCVAVFIGFGWIAYDRQTPPGLFRHDAAGPCRLFLRRS